MQVSSSTNTYQYQSSQTKKSLTDSQREFATDIADRKSTQAQIDAYAKGTQNANDNLQNTTQNSMEFASNVKKANNYATLVENGVDISQLKDRPSTQPIRDSLDLNPQDFSEEQIDTLRQTATNVADLRSTQAQIDTYVAVASSNEPSANPYTNHADTQEYINNYNDFAQQVKRSENLNTYIENS